MELLAKRQLYIALHHTLANRFRDTCPTLAPSTSLQRKLLGERYSVHVCMCAHLRDNSIIIFFTCDAKFYFVVLYVDVEALIFIGRNFS